MRLNVGLGLIIGLTTFMTHIGSNESRFEERAKEMSSTY
jgi:hypothetical protein